MHTKGRCGELMVSALESGLHALSSSLNQGTAFCSWTRHFTLTMHVYHAMETTTSASLTGHLA